MNTPQPLFIGYEEKSAKKKRILIICDITIFRRQLVKDLFEDYEVLEAGNREEAMQYLSKEAKPDLIILDPFLPPRSGTVEEGFTILKEFKIAYPEVRVIVTSSDLGKKAIELIKNLGAEGYFTEPPDLDTLREYIVEVLTSPALRRWNRIKMEVPVEYEYRENFVIKDTTYSKNISLAGIMMNINYYISLMNFITLGISLPDIAQSLEATGQVKWRMRIEDDTQYQVGIQFTQIKEEGRHMLADYIYRENQRSVNS